MELKHLISTMHRSNFDFINSMNIKAEAIVVNQANISAIEEYHLENKTVKMITTTERGLSNSRNMLMDNAEGDIGIIGDDDVVYYDGYDAIIRDAYKRYPKADIITFRFSESPDIETRKIFSKERKLGLFQISKVASVEVTFRINSVKDKLRFCNLLGLGAEFGSGEENAFLADALRAGLKIQHVNKTICYSLPATGDREKWRNGYNEEYFVSKGACFFRIYGGILFLPMCCAFVLLKKRSLFKNVKILNALGWMLSGRKKFKEAEARNNVC